MVTAADGGEDVRLNEVDEGQVLLLVVVEVDEGPGAAGLPATGYNPTAERFLGHAQVMSRFRHGIVWQATGIFGRPERHFALSNTIG